MGKNIKNPRLVISADLENAEIIMLDDYKAGSDMHGLNVNVDDDLKKHPCLSYTTDIETLRLIFQNMTLRSSSLSYAKLNDSMEKQRVGISQFAGNRFITCFCHMGYETVPFWQNYGKDVKENKVLLQFKNFSEKFEDCISLDYAYADGGKKCAFDLKNLGEIMGSVQKDEYDLRRVIDAVLMFDVEYVPVDSDVFTERNDGESAVDFGRITGQENARVTMHGYDLRVLGKQKSKAWEYENETRILCSIAGGPFNNWNYIDLRLKPEIFRDLKIVLSPWDDGNAKAAVQKIIDECALPDEVKNSISIVDSALKGTLNF